MPARAPGSPARPVPTWTTLTTFFAATTVVASVIAVGLAALAIQHGVLVEPWAGLAPGALTPTAEAAGPSLRVIGAGQPSSMPPLPPARVLDLGQLGAAGDWTFVVDKAGFYADPTANGWSRASVTLLFENTGPRTTRLNIPATTTTWNATGRSRDDGPSVLPLPAPPAKTSAAIDGLHLLLRDASGREFGGGFGSDLTSYDLIAAPGDVLRLPYNFRYPSTSVGPFTIRLTFPEPANTGAFDVHVDQASGAPAQLPHSTPPLELAAGSWQTVEGEWAVAPDGVDFGSGRGSGERPVTMHLKVKNLTDVSLPALIDRGDRTGMSRDFYLVDPNGNLAYSHVDTQPSVIVPPSETRDVAVQLFTTDLVSSSSPLVFTAVLNWHTNTYLRFRLG
ncbi:MAG TPA: hypothetical protein VKT80_12925 [Chloroflexota bacterium]|nr:hypothetical protein [Chloroflexota bacterium]